MTSFLPGRRRAEEFAQTVEGTRTTRDPRVTQLLEVVERVERPAPIEPRPDFSAELRDRLVAEATTLSEQNAGALSGAEATAADSGDTSPPNGPGERTPKGHRAAGSRRQPARRRTRMLAAATAVSLVAGMFGVVSFARDAMPGETLYGLKRSLESTQAAIATTSESRGRHYLASGRVRLSELDSLITAEPGTRQQTEQPRDGDQPQPSDAQQGEQSESSGEPDSKARPNGDGSEADAPSRTKIAPERIALAERTLQDFTRQTQRGGELLLQAYEKDQREAALERLEKFTSESGEQLAGMAPDLPEELGDSFTEATRLLLELDEQISAHCPECASLTPGPEPEPSPTQRGGESPETPSPTPTSPSPTPSKEKSTDPSPGPTTHTPTTPPQPTEPNPTPSPTEESQDESDEDDSILEDTLELPTELPLPSL